MIPLGLAPRRRRYLRSGFEEALHDRCYLGTRRVALWLELVVGDAVQQSFGYCP